MDSSSYRNCCVSRSKICRSLIFKLLHQDVDIRNASNKQTNMLGALQLKPKIILEKSTPQGMKVSNEGWEVTCVGRLERTIFCQFKVIVYKTLCFIHLRFGCIPPESSPHSDRGIEGFLKTFSLNLLISSSSCYVTALSCLILKTVCGECTQWERVQQHFSHGCYTFHLS